MRKILVQNIWKKLFQSYLKPPNRRQFKGQPIDKALELTNKAVVEALDGLPAHKLHCSVLAEEAVKSAIEDYYDKKQK